MSYLLSSLSFSACVFLLVGLACVHFAFVCLSVLPCMFLNTAGMSNTHCRLPQTSAYNPGTKPNHQQRWGSFWGHWFPVGLLQNIYRHVDLLFHLNNENKPSIWLTVKWVILYAITAADALGMLLINTYIIRLQQSTPLLYAAECADHSKECKAISTNINEIKVLPFLHSVHQWPSLFSSCQTCGRGG